MNTPTSSSQPSIADSNPLNIAIVGLRFGSHILEQLHWEQPRKVLKLSAVCDFQESLLSTATEKYGVAGYQSLDELLEKDKSPIIGLFTPPKGRAQLIRKVIHAGRDVLTTKPFELDAKEAQAVLEEARSRGRIVHLNSPSPKLPGDLALIKEWTTKHKLGRAIGGSARVWAPYFEKADGSWYDDPQACPAAPLFRLGIYLFNDFTRVFGPAESMQLMTSFIRTGRPTPDNAQVNLKYQSGALANIFATFCVEDGDHYQNSMVVNFENGTVYRNAGGLRGTDDMSQTEITLIGQGEKIRRDLLEQVHTKDVSGYYQWEVLADAVRNRTLADDGYIADIVEGVKLVDALRRAQETGFAKV